jgi:hypothetical protein
MPPVCVIIRLLHIIAMYDLIAVVLKIETGAAVEADVPEVDRFCSLLRFS